MLNNVHIRAYVLGSISILRYGLVFAIILYGQQTRGFVFGLITGHVSMAALDGTYIGLSLMNVLANLPILGLTNSIDLLGIPALGKAATKGAGLVVQKTMLLSVLISLPIISLLLLIRPILDHIHQDPDVVEATASYLRLSIIIVPVNAVTLCMVKYLYILGRVRAVFYGVVITLSTSLGIFILTAFTLESSLVTLQWSYLLSELILPFLLLIYFLQSKVHLPSWEGFSLSALNNWTQILLTGLPSSVLIVLEWGMYEVLLLLVGAESPEITSVNAVCFTVVSIGYLVHYGIGISATTSISSALISGNVDAARKYTRCSLAVSFISSGVVCGLIILSKRFVMLLYHSPSLDQIAPWALCFIVLDAYQIIINAVLRSYNRYVLPMLITLGSFIATVVAGYALIRQPNLQIIGIWIGMCTGSLICCVCLSVLLYCTPPTSNISPTVVYSLDAVDLVSHDEVDMVSREQGNEEEEDLRLESPVETDDTTLLITKITVFAVSILLVITSAIVNITCF